jgi:hypothetical protein
LSSFFCRAGSRQDTVKSLILMLFTAAFAVIPVYGASANSAILSDDINVELIGLFNSKDYPLSLTPLRSTSVALLPQNLGARGIRKLRLPPSSGRGAKVRPVAEDGK